MKRRPNVRYRKPEQSEKEAEQPSLTAQAVAAAQKLGEDALREIAEETAHELFEQYGGKSLERRLAQDEQLLDVFQQDLDRSLTHPEPDKFRWRVKPAEKIRIGREMDMLHKQIDELRHKAWDKATEMMHYFMHASPETEPAQHEDGPREEYPQPEYFNMETAQGAEEQPEGATPSAA